MMRKTVSLSLSLGSLLMLTSLAQAQSWSQFNEDWEIQWVYDGKDVAVQYVWNPEHTAIVELRSESIWPQDLVIPQGARNFTDNLFLTPFWDSRGEIEVKFKWRHSSTPPSVLKIKVASPTWAYTTSPGGPNTIDSGIGAEIIAHPTQCGLEANGWYLRKVKIGVNGEGSFLVTKEAHASFTGNENSAHASANELVLYEDIRDVSIVGQNTNFWPNRRKLDAENQMIFMPTSQDFWSWYEPIDDYYQDRWLVYNRYVPAPAIQYFPSGDTDYADWDLGFPIDSQISLTTYDWDLNRPVTELFPPIIPTKPASFRGAVVAPAVEDQFGWSGLVYPNFGTISALPLSSELLYSAEYAAPYVRKNVDLSVANVYSGYYEYYPRSSTEVKTVSFTWYYQEDGLRSNSVRKVQFHPAKDVGEAESLHFLEYNVGLSAATTYWELAQIINPLGNPASDVPELAGFVSPGYESAEFLPLSMGYDHWVDARNSADTILALCSEFPIPVLSTYLAVVEAFAPGSGGMTPDQVTAELTRDFYNAPGGNGRWTDYLKVLTPSVQGEESFENPVALQTLKNQLSQRGTNDLYWELRVRSLDRFWLQETNHWGNSGFDGQYLDQRSEPVSWPLCFRRYCFKAWGY